MKTTFRALLAATGLVAIFSAGISLARAATPFIAADIQNSGSTLAQTGFERWAIGATDRTAAIAKTFQNEFGTSGAVTVLLNSTTGAFGGVDRGSSTFGSGFQYADLYNDGVMTKSFASGLQVQFQGLSANTSYEFTFFTLDIAVASGSASTTTVTWGGGNLLGTASYTAGDMANYDSATPLGVVATTGIATTNASGVITFTINATNSYDSGGDNRVMLNGFTVSMIPEPGASAAIAAAFVLMLAVCRRQRS